MRADKGGASLHVLSQEGNLDGEQSANSEGQLRGLKVDNLEKERGTVKLLVYG